MGNHLFAGCTSENSLTCNSIQVKCKLSLCRIYPMLDSQPACSSEQMIGLRLKSFGGCRVTSFRGRPFLNDLSSSGDFDSSTHFDENGLFPETATRLEKWYFVQKCFRNCRRRCNVENLFLFDWVFWSSCHIPFDNLNNWKVRFTGCSKELWLLGFRRGELGFESHMCWAFFFDNLSNCPLF